jgi:undecaprenyl-diphosphatase
MNVVLSLVNASDMRVALSLRAWAPPPWFRLWMRGATRLGDGWFYAVAALGLLLAGRRALPVLAAAALSAAFANSLIVVLKRRFRRSRPCEAGHPAYGVRPPEYFAFDEFSFPSGHALNAFAVSTVLALQFPLAAPLFALVAASIAASRVVMGLHYLSDVVVGAGIGSAIALAVSQMVLG